MTWIRINHPGTMNALNHELLDELNTSFDHVEQDESTRAVVLTGVSNAFCAGADLKSATRSDGSVDSQRFLNLIERIGRTIERIPAVAKPVIAAVNGVAAAGGLELMLACDVVIAAKGARIGDAHANFGLVPAAGGATRTARIAGPIVAKYLEFTGTFPPPESLASWGLVNEVVADDELEARAEAIAQQIAGKSSTGLAHMKRLVDEGLNHAFAESLRMELEALAEQSRAPDFSEGMDAFRAKRTPHFNAQ
ncbi:enoyl-CoA hydratase/isomerase family protein [Phytoactinopolyspora endophytica]|uniref:enoyl-CoA hydratase/isomerase family protein n=1 Tax=Phytoactinopolyspora endophytica TaxID=1642495 RepID=UPI0023EA4D98|nr:enoyl-CoA hydratase/isomerase family protein [Phytoactinopolyspora endophytica]